MFARLKSFFTSDEEKLKILKKELTTLVESKDPPEFYDNIGIDSDLFQDPVISDTGQIFEKASISRWLEQKQECPLTRQPLNESKLTDAKIIQSSIEDFQRDRADILIQINSMKKLVEEKNIRKQLENYLSRVEKYREHFANIQEVLAIQQILKTKEKLKIDMRAKEHLEFWSEKNCCCRVGLVKVPFKGNVYYLAPRVFNVMLAAKQEHKRLIDFLKAIENARKASVNLGKWATFWSSTSNASIMSKADFLQKNFDHQVKPG